MRSICDPSRADGRLVVEVTLYHAKAQPVGRFWHLSVQEIDRVTQAKTASQIPAMARDLVEVMTGETDFTIENEYVLPAEIAAHQLNAERMRRHELVTRQEAARELRMAVQLAAVGAILGVSHQ